jgi:hypothetical protein
MRSWNVLCIWGPTDGPSRGNVTFYNVGAPTKIEAEAEGEKLLREKDYLEPDDQVVVIATQVVEIQILRAS